jgi:hypothetical protein
LSLPQALAHVASVRATSSTRRIDIAGSIPDAVIRYRAMGEPVADSKGSVYVAVAFAIAGLVLGLVLDSGGGKLAAGLIAAVGAIPAGIGMWKGIQQQTQTTLGMALGALLLALGVAAAMIIWAIIQFVR